MSNNIISGDSHRKPITDTPIPQIISSQLSRQAAVHLHIGTGVSILQRRAAAGRHQRSIIL
jgi:hypothetical protein